MAAIIINGNPNRRMEEPISVIGTIKEEMAVMATTIIIVLDTRFASTTAVPITKPPTTPIVCAILLGSLIEASLKISKVICMPNASISGGYGTFSKEDLIENTISVGRISK